MRSIKKAVACLLVLLGLLTWEPAGATILFGGGEDLDVTTYGAVTIDTGNTNQRRTSYARSSFSITNVGTAGDPSFNRIVTPVFANQASIWIHAETGETTDLITRSGDHALCVFGSDGVCRFVIRGTGSYSQVKLSKRTSAAVYTDLVTCSAGWPLLLATKFDLFLNYAVSGSVTLYSNGVPLCTYTGDVTTDGVTAVNQVYFASPNNPSFAGPVYWSEIIIATTDTRDMNLFTCAPQANGTTQNWTGAASDVNEVTINDATSISTTSTGTVGNFTCPSLPAGSFTVPAVIQSARIQGIAGSITNFRFNSRPAGAGSDFDTTADIPVTGVFGNYPNSIITTNPNTSGAWTTSALGAGVNFGIKSRP